MPLDHAHIRYLSDHHQGRLATVAPDGTPQNKPVGYYYNPELGTIDIAGFTMDTSAKWHRPSAGSGWTSRPLVATDAEIVTAMIDDLDRWLSPTPTTQPHRRRARGEAERHR